MKYVLFSLAICSILSGCSNSYYSKILLAESNQNKWSTKTSPKEKTWDTLNYCGENKCDLNAVLYATSGFHFENYAVFESNRIIVTIAYGDSVTQKGQTGYIEADLAWIIDKLEAEDKCKAWSGPSDVTHGDFIAYNNRNGIRLCFEESGYWNERNKLHSWFWSSYGEALTWSYQKNT